MRLGTLCIDQHQRAMASRPRAGRSALPTPLPAGPYQTSVHTEGQRQTQAAGHLNLAGSGLHDRSDAGAGADLRSRPSIGTLRLPSRPIPAKYMEVVRGCSGTDTPVVNPSPPPHCRSRGQAAIPELDGRRRQRRIHKQARGICGGTRHELPGPAPERHKSAGPADGIGKALSNVRSSGWKPKSSCSDVLLPRGRSEL